MSYNPGDHTVEEVRAYIEQHPDEADAVLAAEQARGDQARSTLTRNATSSTSQRRPGDGSGLRQIHTERSTHERLPIEQTEAYKSREAKGWTPQSEATGPFNSWWETAERTD